MGSTSDAEALRMAARVLAEASAFDSTIPAASEIVTRGWAAMIGRSGLTADELSEGVLRVYSRDEEPPRNKVGAIMAEARKSRRERNETHRREIERAERAALPQRALEGSEGGGWTGSPVEGAYEAHGALGVRCGACGAREGAWCEDSGRTRRMPHLQRLALGYRGSSVN